MKYTKIVISMVLSIIFSASVTAQTVSVQQLRNDSFAVHSIAARGGTPEDAGQMAMQRACEETQRRGYTHFGVNEYRTQTRNMEVETQSSGQDYHVTGQGQVYNTPRAAHSTTIAKGTAVLVGVAMMEDTAIGENGMVDTMQIIDARSCSVVD